MDCRDKPGYDDGEGGLWVWARWLRPPWLCPVRRGGGDGVFGPGVAGVAALQVLGDVFPAAAPEAGEVACRLDRAMGWGEQHQEEWDAAIGDAGVAVEAEEFLYADFEGGAVLGSVVDGEMAAGGGGKVAWEQAVDLLFFCPGKQGVERLAEVVG